MYRHSRANVYSAAAVAGGLAPGGFTLVLFIPAGISLNNSMTNSVLGAIGYAGFACAAFGLATVPVALLFSASALWMRTKYSARIVRLLSFLAGLLLGFGICKLTASWGLPGQELFLPLVLPYCSVFCLSAAFYITACGPVKSLEAA